MAKPLKTAGLQELAALRKRIVRQLGLKRISRHNHDRLIDLADQMEAIIVSMDEETGEEGEH